jgi:hypothetical protein
MQKAQRNMADRRSAVPEGLVGQSLWNIKEIPGFQRQRFSIGDDFAPALFHIGQKVKGGPLSIVGPVISVEVETDKPIAGREKHMIHPHHPFVLYRILPFLNRIAYCGQKTNMI